MCGNTCVVGPPVIKNVPVKVIVHDTLVKPYKIVYDDIPAPSKKKKGISNLFFWSNPGSTDTPIIFKPYSPVVIDSAGIVRDWLAHIYYNDTIRIEFGYIVIVDTVSRNRLQGRSVLTNMDIPTKTITRTIDGSTELYGSLIAGFGVGGRLSLKTKKNHLFSGEYMLTQHGGIVGLGYGWKIKFGK